MSPEDFVKVNNTLALLVHFAEGRLDRFDPDDRKWIRDKAVEATRILRRAYYEGSEPSPATTIDNEGGI